MIAGLARIAGASCGSCTTLNLLYHSWMPDPDNRAHLHPSDLRALARLLADATVGVTDVVEGVHIGVAPATGGGGLAPLTYRTIRSATRFIGAGMDAALIPLEGLLGARQGRPPQPTPQRRAALAALNGVMGDYLADDGNPLALPMTFRRDGADLPTDPAALAAALPDATGRLLLLVHGLCLGDACWACAGGGLGGALARDRGYTPVSLSYNSGRHISSNGRELADRLAALVTAWPRPVEELVIVGHSMGGLVARSACVHGARHGHTWLGRLDAMVFLGTPHRGAPLERGGHWFETLLQVSPYSAPFARLGKIRSAGITDLRHSAVFGPGSEGDRAGAHVPPLPEGVRCLAIGATLGRRSGDLKDRLIGDGIVPLPRALGRGGRGAPTLFARDAQWVSYETSHLGLLERPEVYQQIRRWLAR